MIGLVSVSTTENLHITHFHHENCVNPMCGISGNLTHFVFLFFLIYLFLCSFKETVSRTAFYST